MFKPRIYSVLFMSFFLTACGGGSTGASPDGGNSNPPPPPVGIVVSANDAANTLQWNSVPGATGYNIYWSTVSGTGLSGTKISNASSPYTHTPLTNGITVYYVITTVNSVGESAPSVEASGTPAISPPGAPYFGSVIPGDRQITLNWNPVAGATSYNLYWSTVSGGAVSGTKIANVSSPYQHSGLTNGTTYYYVLRAVSSGGESGPSGVVNATPFVPPYATQQYPFDLGSAPLGGYAEALPGDTTKFHYMLSATPGSTYMFSLNNVVDGASLEVFGDTSWALGFASCSDYSYSYSKQRLQCFAIAPASGLFYIRIGATTNYAENASLKVDAVVNQGSVSTPINLGTAPTSLAFGTVLKQGQSIYTVAVTPGSYYRVKLPDWRDSGGSNALWLGVFDGAYSGPDVLTAPNRLCFDSSVSDLTIQCLAKPTSNYLTIVTSEQWAYSTGAAYKVAVEAALNEGTQSTPVNIAGDTVVYHGEARAEPDTYNYGHSFYKLSVAPNTSYLVDLRGMHEQLDFVIAQDSSFTLSSCNSRQFNLIDESCTVNSGATGNIYALVETPDKVTDTFILSAMPVPVGAVAPARYPNEGSVAAPLSIGPALPVSNRLSTVGAGSSYYSIPVTPSTTMRVSATMMNADVDIHVYSDSGYLNRLCASRNTYTQDDSCTFTVPGGIGTIYIRVDGQFTTNNGSWASGTEYDVGAMFRLAVEAM